jgi:glycosyltransferase involved in cell wall biosynthesis
MTTRFFFEGWRFSPTSYAVVLQHHLLDIMSREGEPARDLYFRDLPFHASFWKQERGLFPPELEAKIASLGEPSSTTPIDVSFRMAHPTLVRKTSARQSWCWIVTEFGILEQKRLQDSRPVAQALRTPGVRLMTPSNWAKEGLVRSGADPDNITVVPHGYDPAIMTPASRERRDELRTALGWQGRFVFLNVSTLVWNKGIAGLLRAFAQVIEKHPEALLVLKGSDAMLKSDQKLRDSIAELPAPIAARVVANLRYLGQNLTFAQIADLFRAADCYAAPYHAEGFNMPAMEAAACGLPVLCTDGGPTDDFTTPEFCRRIRSRVESHPGLESAHGPGACVLIIDGEHLAQLMLDVIQNESFRAQARVAGPAFLSQRFTWRHVTDRFLAALESEPA